MFLLFFISSRPVVEVASGIPDWITHGGGYAALAVLVCRALAGGLFRPLTAAMAGLAVLISTLYGVTDELHQSFVPGRVADAWDLLKNFGGAAAGALACAWPRPEREQRGKAA
jgi:VanZ family protein